MKMLLVGTRLLRITCWVLVATLFITATVQAKNPEISTWMSNLSESSLPTAASEYDATPEIAVVGTTIHAMWLTRNADWSGYKVFYRRSTNNGTSWEPKQLVFESSDFVSDNTYRRMAVSGNSVHIAVSHYEGSWHGVLTYLRSTDNGASFEPPRQVFTAAHVYHVYDVYVAANGADVTIGFRNQCNWCVNNSYLVLLSSDGGTSFGQGVAYSAESGGGWKVSDMQRIGQNLYVLFTESYYYYGLQYSKLYVASSPDGGVSFTTTKLSFPSKSGADKQGWSLHDHHYSPKIAGVGNAVSVIWSGYDADDVHAIFLAHSADAGRTWAAPKNLTAGTVLEGKPIQAGQETLASAGSYVYALFLTTDAKAQVRRSANSGDTFFGPQELTSSTPYTNQAWWPLIQTDPADVTGATVHVLWMQPAHVYSTDGGATFTRPELVGPNFSLGNFGVGAVRPQMALGANGHIHYLMEGQLYSSALCGGYCDVDIFYRHITKASQPVAQQQTLKVVSIRDADRYDNMHVRSSDWLDFSSKLTAEVWVKPSPGGRDTGSSSYIKPIFHKQKTSAHAFAYSVATWGRSDKRQAIGIINTSAGEFFVVPEADVGLVADNQWTHLALTYDAAGGPNNLKLYMNGLPIASRTATGSLASTDGLFFVGRYGIWEVDELRLWNAPRSQAEIAANLHKRLIGNESGLNAYYSFDGTTKDITGHGNDGRLMYQESFAARSTFMLTVTRDLGGMVSSPSGIHCPPDCSEALLPNASVTLTATPEPGYLFAGWGGACQGTATVCTVPMDANKAVQAQFVIN